MPEYLGRPKHPLTPDAAEMVDKKAPLKSCGHAPDYRCCCYAHQDAEQDSQDCYDEMRMPIGYKLGRAYSVELYGMGGRADA